MSGVPLDLENPIRDTISSVRFAPESDNLLISSWDTTLRLYDVGSSLLRLESPSDAAILDCCFQNESVAFSAGSDGSIRRYDLQSGTSHILGNHDDISTCIGYSDETCQVISAGFDKKINTWDMRTGNDLACSVKLPKEVDSMSLSGFNILVAVGESVNMYDLRNLETSIQSNRLDMNVQIRCVSSAHCSKGFAYGTVDGRVAIELSIPSSPDGIRYVFWCYPKKVDRRYRLVSVNDIIFNPHVDGAFITGDNDGYVTAWDAKSRRRQFEFPRCPNSVTSLSLNQRGCLLAVASSCSHQEANENEELSQIIIHEINNAYTKSDWSGSSSRN